MLKFKKDSFVQNLAHRKHLVPLLDRVKFDKPWTFEYEPKQGDTAWHPSGDCLPTPLDLYKQAQEPMKPDFPPSLLRTFMVGHFWHQYIQTILVEEGLAAPDAIERRGSKVWGDPQAIHSKEDLYFKKYLPSSARSWPDTEDGLSKIEPKPHHWAAGSGDVVPLVVPGFTGILDIKTMNSNDFKAMELDGVLPYRFADKYEAQINIYMDFFDQDQGMILGVNKDSGRFAEVTFERNQRLIDDIYHKWIYVSECLDDETPPEPDEDFPLIFTGPRA